MIEDYHDTLRRHAFMSADEADASLQRGLEKIRQAGRQMAMDRERRIIEAVLATERKADGTT